MDTPPAPHLKIRPVWLFLSALLLIALGLISFFTWLDLSGSRGAYEISASAADLDNDGDLDVIVRHSRWETDMTQWGGTTLWFNDGSGRFTPYADSSHPAEGSPFSLYGAAGDVDGDGDLDIVGLDMQDLHIALNQGGAQGGTVGVFKRYGRAVNTVGNPAGIRSEIGLLLGDLDGDGDMDGFVAGCCNRTFQNPHNWQAFTPSFSWVWVNVWNPRGWLEPHSAGLQALGDLRMRAAAMGDLDGDGDLDVFAAVGSPQVGQDPFAADRILLNNGLGGFRDSGQRLGASDSTAVALGDMDGDGDLDALVGTRTGAVVWLNNGGIFTQATKLTSADPAAALFFSDLDRDGDLDALVAGKKQALIGWNDGQAGFTLSGKRFHYSERQATVTGDFNGDGEQDVLAASSEDFKVWFNQGAGTFR